MKTIIVEVNWVNCPKLINNELYITVRGKFKLIKILQKSINTTSCFNNFSSNNNY